MSEFICYSGCAVSAAIAARLLMMGNLHTLTFYNRMFILYYMLESVIGALEEYFLFRVKEHRSLHFTEAESQNINDPEYLQISH